MGQPTAYNTALYMRLSKEDGLDGDSASIQSELESRVAELNKIVNSTREYGRNAAEFVEMMKEFANIDELTQATLNRVISRIDVHEAEIIDGESVTVIDVHYKFVGIID